MAVGAEHDALRNLRRDRRPFAVANHTGHSVALFAPRVVKLKHHWIGLAAVEARVAAQILEHLLAILGAEPLLAAARARPLRLGIPRIVSSLHAVVTLTALRAQAVGPRRCLIEGLGWQLLIWSATCRTSFGRARCHSCIVSLARSRHDIVATAPCPLAALT
jgi:hypothetical protein